MLEQIERATSSMEIVGEYKFMGKRLADSQFTPKIDFEKINMAVSANGGMMAIIKKSDRLIMDKNNIIESNIRIFCQNGTKERTIYFPTDKKERCVVLFEFTVNEKLMCVFHNGIITKFDIFTCTFTSYPIGNCFTKDNIIRAKLFENGFCALTKDGVFYIVKSFKDTVPIKFYEVKKRLNIDSFTITDFAFIPAKLTQSGRTEVIFATTTKHGLINIVELTDLEKEELEASSNYINNQPVEHFHNVYYIKNKQKVDYKRNVGADSYTSHELGIIRAIEVSPTSEFFAVYRKEDEKCTNAVYVFKTNFDEDNYPRKNLSYDLNRTRLNNKEKNEILDCLTYPEVTQFKWCGEEGLCICSRRYVILVNMVNNVFKFQMMTSKLSKLGEMQFMHCLTEVDGLRVIMNDGVSLIFKVPEEVDASCYVFSDEPARKLITAYISSEEKNPICDEQIRKLIDKGELSNAVLSVVNASAQMWDREIQKILLNAAHYGKGFLSKDSFNYYGFMSICNDIRIINNLRLADNARFISYDEYKSISEKEILKRIMGMHEFFIAEQTAKQLRLKSRKVFQKWAITQIKAIPNGLSEVEQYNYYNLIQKKLSQVPNISYIKIAKKAFKSHKDNIGLSLLDNEKSILIKIPQYIQMKRWDKALVLTLETYDQNMMNTIIAVIYQKEEFSKFCHILRGFKKMDPIVFQFLKKKDPFQYTTYLEENNNNEELFFYYLEQYFNSNTIENRNKYLRLSKETKKKIVTTKDSTFDSKFYDSYLHDLEAAQKMKTDLLRKEILKQTDISTFDSSTFDIYQMIIKEHNNGELDSKYTKSFDINRQALTGHKIRAMALTQAARQIPVMIMSEIKNNNYTYMNAGEYYVEIDDKQKAVEALRNVTKFDQFYYKLELLLSIEKYQDALECVISDKNFTEKQRKVNEILQKAPQLNDYVNDLCKKYKVTLE